MEQQTLFDPTLDDRGQALLRLRERTLAKRPAAPYRYTRRDETVTEHHWDTDEWTRYFFCVELMDLALSLPRRGGFRPEWKAHLQKYYRTELHQLRALLAPTYGNYYANCFLAGTPGSGYEHRLKTMRP
jgi:hypothetical protein